MSVVIATLNTEPVTASEFVSSARARDGRGQFNEINQAEFAIVDAMFDTSADCRAAYETLKSNILSAPLKLCGMEVDDRLEGQMQGEYRSLCASAIRDLLKYGLTIVTIDRKTMLPYTVPPSLLRIQHRSVIGGPSEYRIFAAKGTATGNNIMGGFDQTPMNDLLVFERCAPDASGHLTGPMAALLNLEAFRNAMMRAAAVAFKRMSMPGVYTVEKDTSIAQETLQRDFTAIGESTALATHAVDVQEQLRADRERVQASHRAQQSTMTMAAVNPSAAARAALFGAGDDGTGGVLSSIIDPLTRIPAYGADAAYLEPPPMIPLPVNRDVKAAPQAHAPVGLADTEEACEASVAKVFCVPSSLWTGQRRSSTATNQTALTAFYSSLQMWRVDLQTILHRVLTYTVGDIHVDQLRAFAEKGGRDDVRVLDRRTKSQRAAAAAAAAEDTDTDSSSSSSSSSSSDDEDGKERKKDESKEASSRSHKRRAGGAVVTASGEAAAAAAGATEGPSEAEVAKRARRVTVGEQSIIVPRTRATFVPSRRLEVVFPALLDATIIESLRATGALSWKTYIELPGSYSGSDQRLLQEGQLEPTTQMPIALETLRARRVEQTAMDRGLVELAAATTGSEALRASVPNLTVGGPPFTGATAVPAMPGNSSGGALKKKRKKPSKDGKSKGDDDGDDMEKPKPARAAIKSTQKAAARTALDKGAVRTDATKDPVTQNPALRSAV